jgi:hypothetical protein
MLFVAHRYHYHLVCMYACMHVYMYASYIHAGTG